MQRFDHSDFERNPAKYQLFHTARVAMNIYTCDGESDLEAGQYVAVKHMRNAWNGLRRREEPVYSITHSGKVWGVMFASTLCDFCL
jgi:hypothetical protein